MRRVLIALFVLPVIFCSQQKKVVPASRSAAAVAQKAATEETFFGNIYKGWSNSILGKALPRLNPSVLIPFLEKNKALKAFIIAFLVHAATDMSSVQHIINVLIAMGIPGFLVYDAIQSTLKEAIPAEGWNTAVSHIFASTPILGYHHYFNTWGAAVLPILLQFPLLANLKSAFDSAAPANGNEVTAKSNDADANTAAVVSTDAGANTAAVVVNTDAGANSAAGVKTNSATDASKKK